MSDDLLRQLQEQIAEQADYDSHTFLHNLKNGYVTVELDGHDEVTLKYVDGDLKHNGYCDYDIAYVFEVHGRYFARQGTTDSWVNTSWHGPLMEVQRRAVLLKNWVPVGEVNPNQQAPQTYWETYDDSWGQGDSWS